ncbi:MAG: LamG domain-containing protein [Pirellulales bacterium]|nr:LamG domain-containing protein [Pirellulales bacterium]
MMVNSIFTIMGFASWLPGKWRFMKSAIMMWTVLCLGLALFVEPGFAQEEPVTWWRFDDQKIDRTKDVAGGQSDKIVGICKRVEGVSGTALKLDGFTSAVFRPAAAAPKLSNGFTVEAWIAVRAYPWGWCPIVSQRQAKQAGYFFGIDAQGRLGLHMSVAGEWIECTSQTKLPLLKWTHVAGCFDSATGLRLYIDGKPVGSIESRGKMYAAKQVDLLVGRNHGPEPAMFETKKLPVYFSVDGLLDEVKIYNRPLSGTDIELISKSLRPKQPRPLEHSRLPSGPPVEGRFGAFYEHLKYHPSWDAHWRGSGPDIVVVFDKAPFRLVCWRGISYAPCWITEKGNWFTNEFMERGVDRENRGCSESMSDKRAVFSHVKILENNDARAVVYWRHSPVGINYQQPYVDKETGWGDWSEEYHTIYPDGVAVRKVVMYSGNLEQWHEYCQSIEILHPGQRPEDILDEHRILSLANMKGKGKTYGWIGGAPSYKHPTFPGANIQITYLRSHYNPFLIIDDRPGMNDFGGQGPAITLVVGDNWSKHSKFPWRNHWPVTQVPIIGRYAVAADRPAHTYTSTQHGAALETTHNSLTKVILCGMTNKKEAVELLPLARSWLRAAEMKIASKGYRAIGYDLTERAYVVQRTDERVNDPLVCRINADRLHPLINPALVVKDWGDRSPLLKVDGNVVPRGPSFRFGHINRLDGVDLVVWMETETTSSCTIELDFCKIASQGHM